MRISPGLASMDMCTVYGLSTGMRGKGSGRRMQKVAVVGGSRNNWAIHNSYSKQANDW